MNTGGPKRDGSDMSLGGVYFGIVTQNKDDEKKLARVKVRLPWMPGGDDDQAHWARVAVPLIGGEFGTFVLPEVGDQVLVMFIAGDIRWPVVIGAAWNKTDEPPETNDDGKNDFRLIKSRSGHRLLLDDSSNTKIAITDLANEQYVGVGKFAEGGSSSNKMKLDAPQAINGSPSEGVAMVTVGGTLNLWAPKGKLQIDAMHVELTAADAAEVKSGQDLTLKGKMMGTVAASQKAEFGGSKVKVN